MKTLLPILKTNLFLLGFVSACTVILATTVPQIKNFIASEKAIGEKITTEQKKTAPKINKKNKTISSSRVISGVSLEMNNSFEATDNHIGAPETANRTMAVNSLQNYGNDIVVVSTPATSAGIMANNAQMEVAPDLTKFDVKAFSNPSGDQFTLYLENATNEKVSIVVFDALGREVKKFEKESGNIPIHLGLNFKVGMYVVEVRQGDNRKTLKLVKQ
jgi:hypothetical protein